MRKAIIMGAGGRDFHNFNVYFRDNPTYRVVAFTAAQIPFLAGRRYPPELSGPNYPEGIPIYDEKDLPQLIAKYGVTDVFFSYSDVSYEYVMRKAALVNACGASFHLLGPDDTMLKSNRPVVAVVAIRTGAGKSPISRFIARFLRGEGMAVGIVRHPMAYGDLLKKRVMKFSSFDDLDRYDLTIEEREDFEPHILNGFTVYAGVDYAEVLKLAEENDIILWDGGNNDYPFIKPNLYITVVDPYRYDHMDRYYPSGINIRLADIAVITKVDTAPKEMVAAAISSIRRLNNRAEIIKVSFKAIPDKEVDLKNKKVLVIEDGPTITHGEMPYGMGYIYAKSSGAIIVDPRRYAVGTIREAYMTYKHIGPVLPALGYSRTQIEELETTINNAPVDYIVSATPTDISRYLHINKDIINVRYEVLDIEGKFLKTLRSKIKEIVL